MSWFIFFLLFATAGVLRADDQSKLVGDKLMSMRDDLVDVIGDLKAYSWLMNTNGDMAPIPHMENILRIIQFVINDVTDAGVMPVDLDVLVVQKLQTSDQLKCTAKVTWSEMDYRQARALFKKGDAPAPRWHGVVARTWRLSMSLIGLDAAAIWAGENVLPIEGLLRSTKSVIISFGRYMCTLAVKIDVPAEQFLTDYGKFQEHILMGSINLKPTNAKTETQEITRTEPDARSARGDEEDDGYLQLHILRRCMNFETSNEKRDCLKKRVMTTNLNGLVT